jgi:undecaprenyl-diphosphatase
MRVAGLAGAALASGILASTKIGNGLDVLAFRSLNRDRGRGADRFFGGITELGSIWASVGASAVIAATGRRGPAARGLVAASAAWLAGQGLKKLFLRPRPYVAEPGSVRLRAHPPPATSWPSSHPAVLLAFVTVSGRELGLPGWARSGLNGVSCVVGLSRTYLGVHYPSDVIGGLLLGRAVGDALSRDGR